VLDDLNHVYSGLLRKESADRSTQICKGVLIELLLLRYLIIEVCT